MLLSAIRIVQNIQLVCFAIVFGCMVAQSRKDLSLRWLLGNYIAGAFGALSGLRVLPMPDWLVNVFSFEVPQLRYAFLHLAVVCFTGRGERTRWLGIVLSLVCLPVYLLSPGVGPQVREYALLALTLAVQTACTAWLLLRASEETTRWPRNLMGVFLGLYCAVEMGRVVVSVHTGRGPAEAAPWLESISIVLFVVASSLTPLAFIWMLNSRLLGDLKQQSVIDPLTGILNRRGFEDHWERVFESYRETGENFALAVADIDHFKKINDTYGHAQGDAVLHEMANLLRSMLREGDLAGRLGGEEFVLILSQVDQAQAERMVEKLRSRLANYTFRLGDSAVQISASFGLTVTGDRSSLTMMGLLQEADFAMYEAKEGGRNRLRLYAGRVLQAH